MPATDHKTDEMLVAGLFTASVALRSEQGARTDKTSCERILYAIFTGINQAQGTVTPFPPIQNA